MDDKTDNQIKSNHKRSVAELTLTASNMSVVCPSISRAIQQDRASKLIVFQGYNELMQRRFDARSENMSLRCRLDSKQQAFSGRDISYTTHQTPHVDTDTRQKTQQLEIHSHRP